jgi:hypothetical protein
MTTLTEITQRNHRRAVRFFGSLGRSGPFADSTQNPSEMHR